MIVRVNGINKANSIYSIYFQGLQAKYVGKKTNEWSFFFGFAINAKIRQRKLINGRAHPNAQRVKWKTTYYPSFCVATKTCMACLFHLQGTINHRNRRRTTVVRVLSYILCVIIKQMAKKAAFSAEMVYHPMSIDLCQIKTVNPFHSNFVPTVSCTKWKFQSRFSDYHTTGFNWMGYFRLENQNKSK